MKCFHFLEANDEYSYICNNCGKIFYKYRLGEELIYKIFNL